MISRFFAYALVAVVIGGAAPAMAQNAAMAWTDTTSSFRPEGFFPDEDDKPALTYRGAPKNVKQFTVGGIDVIMRPTGGANHVIAAKVFIRGGASAIPANTSPAIEELALSIPPLSGPKDMAKADYRRLIDRMFIGITPTDGRDFSTMTLRCVDENFDRSWELLTGVIMKPKYDETELRNAKSRMVSAIRNRMSSPEAYAGFIADSAFFAGHPYGRYATEREVESLTAKQLEDHYKNLFVKSRMLLVVVGNVDSADLRAKIMNSLAKLPKGSYEEPVVPVPPASRTPRVIVRQPIGGKSPTTYIVARYLAPNRDDSLYYPMLRLTSFLSGSLFREIRIERNLSYAPDADANFGRASYGEISMSTTLPDSAWRVAKGNVIDFFRTYVISDESMKSGLSMWVTSNYLREQTNESQANEMGIAEIYTGSWTNAFRTFDAIQKMSAEEMAEAANRYLKNFTVAIVGDPTTVTREEYIDTFDDDDGSTGYR